MRELLKLLYCTLALLPITGVASMRAQPAEEPGWTTYAGANETRVQIPSKIFSVSAGEPLKGAGERLTTEDGGAELSIYVLRNEGLSPAGYLRKYMTDLPSQLD